MNDSVKDSGQVPSGPLFGSQPEIAAYIDGASRGNPGPASYGVVIQDAQGRTIDTLSRFLGRATNNVAEWNALIAALEYALSRQSRRVKIYCDSELVARQMQGRYRVHSPDLKPLFEQARRLAAEIGEVTMHHVPRERNSEADLLANQALDNAARAKSSTPGAADRATAAQMPARNSTTRPFLAVCEAGKLRPLPPLPDLEEGAEYEVLISKRPSDFRR